MVNWWRAQNSEACRQNKSNSLNISELQAEREALEPTYSRNIIKLQIINNQALFGVHSKSKSF